MVQLGSGPPQVQERKAWEPEALVADGVGGLSAEASGLSVVQATLSYTSQVRNVWAVDEASA